MRSKVKPIFDMLDRVQNWTLRNGSVKSFLSVKDGGQWMELVEADCYFDSQSSFVKIHLEHFFNESGTFIILHQHCDKTPQFLAQSLEMYNSTDEQCISAHKVNEVRSSLHAAIYKLPPDMLYVCVVAVWRNGTVKSRPYVLLVDNRRGEAQDGVSDLMVAAVASVVSFCIVIVVLSIVICCIKRGQCNHRTSVKEFIRVDLDERDSAFSIPSQYKKVGHQDGASIKTGGNYNINSNTSDYIRLALSPPTDSNESSVSGTVKESLREQGSQGSDFGRVLYHREYGQMNVHFVPLVENCDSCLDSSGFNWTDETWNCEDSSRKSVTGSIIEDSSGCASGSSNVIDSRNCIIGSIDVIEDFRNFTNGSRQDVNDSRSSESQSDSASHDSSCASESGSDTSSRSESTVECTICTINSGTNLEPGCSPKMDSTNAAPTSVDDYATNHYVSHLHLQQLTFQAPESCGESCTEPSDDDDTQDSTF